MGALFDIVEQYRARFSPHEPTYSKVAQEVGVSRQGLLNWKTPTKLPDLDLLWSLSEVTGVPYQRVLDAALDDIGYLNPNGDEIAARRSTKHPPRGPRPD